MKIVRKVLTPLFLAVVIFVALHLRGSLRITPDNAREIDTASPPQATDRSVSQKQEEITPINELEKAKERSNLWKDIRNLFTPREEKPVNVADTSDEQGKEENDSPNGIEAARKGHKKLWKEVRELYTPKVVPATNVEKLEEKNPQHEIENNRIEEPPSADQEEVRPSEVCTSERRLDNIREKCEQHPELAKLTQFQRHLKVDTKHKVLFCLVRKAGSTSVHNLMHMALTGNYMDDPENCGEECWEESGILPLDLFAADKKKEILESYHKIMVVRHPFERYISCWVNKFKTPHSSLHQRVPGLRLIERIRGIPVHMDYEKEVQSWMNITQIRALNFTDDIRAELAKEMTLSEFTKLVDLYEREKIRHDSHWRQMHQVCQPCAIQYDYMVRVETMQFDAKHILQKLNLTEENFPQLNHHRSVTNYKLEKDLPDFSSVPSDVMDTLHKIYQTDLDMFGYTFDKETFTAKCDGYQNNDHHCC